MPLQSNGVSHWLRTNLESAVWFKTKFGSQNFGKQIWFCTRLISPDIPYKFHISSILFWSMIIAEGNPVTEVAAENYIKAGKHTPIKSGRGISGL